MQNSYPLESIDLLATITLNPNVEDLRTFSLEQYEDIVKYLREERSRLQSVIKRQVFATNSTKEVEAIIRKYYSATINIIDTVFANKSKLPDGNPELHKIYEDLLHVLGDLLAFIENRFAKFLSQEEKVALTYLFISKQRLKQKLEHFQMRIDFNQLPYKAPYQLLIKRLNRFTRLKEFDFEITFRTLFYKRELVKGLESMEIDNNQLSEVIFTQIDKLLIYLNYNSKSYIDELTLRLYDQISSFESSKKKVERLCYFRKTFRQLHRKPGFILNPNYHDLDVVIEKWFEEEISYWEKQISFGMDLEDTLDAAKKKDSESMQKILCSLSADQVALILRGADEARIFVANSITEVFRTVVPYLSTPHRKDLSYESMRTKSYVAEDRDKQLAIEALHKIAKRIESY
ncbi:hypothetical protein E6C50_01890 [Flavobacterium supellecticarium]|uniref:Uncharacterized protein n=1 Tax=Flavobacterium supellecticarium TaxID=2565924 RepID=A0A4S4A3X8_9FLAO|nr:hypothetical protein [Flavobacterium supellecticarium]THF52983.1 hypothetical protein E6C50_01890 [Flavobacterium supellecticarium]